MGMTTRRISRTARTKILKRKIEKRIYAYPQFWVSALCSIKYFILIGIHCNKYSKYSALGDSCSE